jgi:hypothetical protein
MRCPECGKAFDPADATTYSFPPKRQNRIIAVSTTVLGGLIAVGMAQLPVIAKVGASSLEVHVREGVWQACGPLAWLMYYGPTHNTMSAFIVCISVAVWCGWFALICTTRLLKLPYVAHLGVGFFWCLVGCPPTLTGV